MRILRSILGVLLAVMLSQRYKANELDWGSDWAVVLVIKTEQMPCQNHSLDFWSVISINMPLEFQVDIVSERDGKWKKKNPGF